MDIKKSNTQDSRKDGLKSILKSVNKKYGIITIIASIIAVSLITMGSSFEKREIIDRSVKNIKNISDSPVSENMSKDDRDENDNEANQDNSSNNNTESSPYKDGEYTGQAKGFNGDIKVSVKISGGKISSIDILDSTDDKEYLDNAKSVIDEVIKNQNTNVEAVSGATFSSNGILDAVQKALDSGV